MKWATGVTAVTSRLERYLPRTLASIKSAGFDDPVVFVDGGQCQLYSGHTVINRHGNIGAFSHWVLSAWELYLRNPHADRYAMFQDDVVLCRGTRLFLELTKLPSNSYINLYTFPKNENGLKGWHSADQFGMGAMALVFNNEAFRELLGNPRMVNHRLDSTRGNKNVDGTIAEALRYTGWTEYVHTPSLAQHIGEESSMGNTSFLPSTSFKGEEFDAKGLLPCQENVFT